MYTTVTTETLKENLELVSKVSTKHVTLPVLQCVLIQAKEQKVLLTATNLEIGVEVSSKAVTEEEGTVAVPASVLLQTVQYMRQEKVVLKVEGDVLVVEGDGSQTSINTISHDEFPGVPRLTSAKQTIQKNLFALGIKTAVVAASQSSIKPELGSVYIHQQKEHSLTFVATDSFRLMEKTVAQKGVVLDEAIMIPGKNALELARICDLRSEDVSLMVNENQCALQFGEDVYVTSRLTTGSFPDYKQIIPKEYSTHSTLLKADLQHAFKKTNIFLNKFQQVTLDVSDNTITVSANSGEVGATTESIRATTEGDDIRLNFNQRYVADVLAHVVDDSVAMHFAGIGRPLVIEGVSDKNLRYLVMPMNK
jgi:DNA polymerase-3 subunit beta